MPLNRRISMQSLDDGKLKCDVSPQGECMFVDPKQVWKTNCKKQFGITYYKFCRQQ